MPVTATLLGSASGSGVDLAIPVTVNQPAGSLVLGATQIVIALSLDLVGVEAPERM